jgi:L-arabinose isomerase
VPFLEASKAMACGLGYAGEGDVLTASLVGALATAFGRTTFTEIFCPDWQGNALFLSHMGEINPEVVEGKAALIEKPYPFSAALNPAVVVGAPAAGPGVLVNLAPGPDNSFGLIAAPVDILGDSDNASLRGAVRGWVRPRGEVTGFLEQYSLNGGTHHSALVLGNRLEGVVAFAQFADLECVVL